MWKTLSKTDARKLFNTWEENTLPIPDCDKDYIDLRNKLTDIDQKVRRDIENKYGNTNRKYYLYDLGFGIELYKLLGDEYNFTTRLASNNQIWMYMSIKVIPDIIYKRWGLSESRYFMQNRRIWLKTIWWYIHLSWNVSSTETYNLLKGFSTDEIVQLVERVGPNGYRIDVTRELMKQLGENHQGQTDRMLFRRIMKLNTARVKIIEPALTKHGIEGYVKELINYFDKSNRIGKKETEHENRYTKSH